MVTGFMAGATIVFTVPVGLAMLQKTDQRYMALGIMSGVLTILIGVLVTMVIIMITRPLIRGDVRTTGPSETVIDGLNIQELLANLLPLLLIVVAIAAGLKFAPGFMIKAFIIFGRLIDAAVKIILALSIVEYFTGIFTKMFGRGDSSRSLPRRMTTSVPSRSSVRSESCSQVRFPWSTRSTNFSPGH